MSKVLKFIGQSILAIFEGIVFLIKVAAILWVGVEEGPLWAIVVVLTLMWMGGKKS